jgi:hypothetical protein
MMIVYVGFVGFILAFIASIELAHEENAPENGRTQALLLGVMTVGLLMIGVSGITPMHGDELGYVSPDLYTAGMSCLAVAPLAIRVIFFGHDSELGDENMETVLSRSGCASADEE